MRLPRSREDWIVLVVISVLLPSTLVFLIALTERPPSVVNYILIGLVFVIPVAVFAQWRGWDPSLIRTLIAVLIV